MYASSFNLVPKEGRKFCLTSKTVWPVCCPSKTSRVPPPPVSERLYPLCRLLIALPGTRHLFPLRLYCRGGEERRGANFECKPRPPRKERQSSSDGGSDPAFAGLREGRKAAPVKKRQGKFLAGAGSKTVLLD